MKRIVKMIDERIPMNHRVRSLIEKHLYGDDGQLLPNKRARTLSEFNCMARFYPGWWGANYLIGYSEFIQGKLSDEALDDFLAITLSGYIAQEIGVVHHKVDISSFLQSVVPARVKSTSNEELLKRYELAVSIEDFEVDFKSRHGFLLQLSELASVLLHVSVQLGMDKIKALKFLWKSIDNSFERGFDEMIDHECGDIQIKFNKFSGAYRVLRHDVSCLDRLKEIYRKSIIDRFLISYPEIWGEAGRSATDFLGLKIINEKDGVVEKDRLVYRSQHGKCMFDAQSKKANETYHSIVIDYLAGIDDDVLSADNLLLDGSTRRAWVIRCRNPESRMDLLEELLRAGIHHPALKAIDRLGTRLSESACKDAVGDYLVHGGRVKARTARSALEDDIELHQWAYQRCRTANHLLRLGAVSPLSAQQIGALSNSLKRGMLSHDIGI